ncbi:MAG TPA: hypothetical protein VEX18_08650 [Polyangiaceae bacterium]|nr:hypothetical protein [Polyangiaceae bacterium]
MANTSDFDGLDWSGGGYHGAPKPSEKDVFPARVQDAPWKAFAIAIAKAKLGDFTYVSRLVDAFDENCDPLVQKQFKLVLADTAPHSVVDAIAAQLDTDAEDMFGELVFDFAEIVAFRGRLTDIPALLRAHEAKHHLRDAEIIPFYISDILETAPSVLATPGYLPSLSEHRTLVLARLDEVASELSAHGGMQALAYRAEQFSVPWLAKVALTAVRSGRMDNDQRRRFEAATGIDCSSFYKKGRLQPLTAAATLEAFLHEEAEAPRFKPGVRYFWGHPIPKS